MILETLQPPPHKPPEPASPSYGPESAGDPASACPSPPPCELSGSGSVSRPWGDLYHPILQMRRLRAGEVWAGIGAPGLHPGVPGTGKFVFPPAPSLLSVLHHKCCGSTVAQTATTSQVCQAVSIFPTEQEQGPRSGRQVQSCPGHGKGT